MKMILSSILSRVKSKFGQAALTVLVSTLILSHPWLIDWMDETMRKWIMGTAYTIREQGVAYTHIFAKGFNETGGSKALTEEAKRRVK